MNESIWTDGPKNLRKGLDERRAEIDDLRARILVTSDLEERRALEQRLQDVLAQYEPGDREIDGSLFFAR
ncbi:MAG TPA: hypothetical protein VGG06_33400 [Thermoanaerobaculia bacterium]|jgi:hypothetical protein